MNDDPTAPAPNISPGITSHFALLAFTQYAGQMSGDATYWTRGNTFDASLRFYAAAETAWGASDSNVTAMKKILDSTIIPGNQTFFKDKWQPPTGYWADDFGWVALASLAAFEYSGSNDPSDTFLQNAKDCWGAMTRKWDASATATPVPQGIANAADTNNTTGTKNTVVNALYLLLSIRLARTMIDLGVDPSIYVAQTYYQYVWFQAWFTTTRGDQPYLKIPDPKFGGLVHERPYGKSSYETKANPPAENPWTWSGDQGLLLASFAELPGLIDAITSWSLAQSPPISFDGETCRKESQAWLMTITAGVRNLLFFGDDNIVREAPFNSSFTGSNEAAYVAGRGVLFRYMAEIDIKSLTGIDFTRQIIATANAAIQTCDGNTQFGAQWSTAAADLAYTNSFKAAWGKADYQPGGAAYQWTWSGNQPPDSVLQGNGLDILTAAIPLS